MSKIINEAFENIPIESQERVDKLVDELNFNYLKEQIKMCEDSILNGNWNGYSENLEVRKQRLKELKNELQQYQH
jgi:acetyl-CoA carboxylase beta subunit